ncbi:MAG: YfhO family protein [Planctomycetia bacterium]
MDDERDWDAPDGSDRLGLRTADFRLALAIGLLPLMVAAVAAACLPGFALSVDDAVSTVQPSVSAAFRQLAAGRLPLWSDHTQCGMPLYAGGQIIHPATVLGHLIARLGGWHDTEVTTAYLLHLCAGTAAAWMFLRFHGCRRAAAAVGAIGFALAGPFWGLWTNWNPYGWSAAVVPALLLSVDLALGHRGPLRSAWREVCFAAVWAASILVIADPQLIVKQFLLVGAYFLLRADRARWPHAAAILGVAAVLAAGCGLAQCLAVREYVAQTTRVSAGGVHPADFFFMGVPVAALAGLVDPFVAQRWIGFGADHLQGAAITIGPLLPVLAGVVLARAWWTRSVTRSLSLIVAATLVLAVGDAFPPNALLLRVPLVNNFRWPVRWMLEARTVGPLLVGFGVDLLLRRLARQEARPVAVRCAGAFAGLWCLRAVACDWPQPAASAGWFAAGGLVVAALLAAAWRPARSQATVWFARAAVGLAVIGGCLAVPGAQRQRFAAPDLRNLARSPLRVEVGPQERVWPCLPLQVQRELTSGGNLVYGMPRQFDLRTVSGYGFPLRWQTWAPFMGLQGQISSFPAFHAAVLDPQRPGLLHLLRVGAIVVAAADEPSRRLLDAHPDFVRQDATGQIVVYRHTGFREPAWFVRELLGVPPGPVPLHEIDTTRTAVAIVPGATGVLRRGFSPGGTVTGFEERHGQIEVAVTCPGDGLLVIGSTFYPGWEARVDGRPAQVKLVDGGFMAVEVPAGTTRVEFRYAPRWLVATIWFSLAVWLLVHGLCIGRLLPDWLRRPANDRPAGRPAGRDDRPAN